jgi:hypothetical protein
MNTFEVFSSNEQEHTVVDFKQYVSEIEARFWLDSDQSVSSVIAKFLYVVYNDMNASSDQTLDTTTISRDQPQAINNRTETISRFSELVKGRFEREKDWVSRSLNVLLFGNLLQRLQFYNELKKRAKKVGHNVDYLLSRLKADRSKCLEVLQSSDSCVEANKHLVESLLKILVTVYDTLRIDDQQIVSELKAKKEILPEKKERLFSRREFLIGSGLAAAGVGALAAAPGLVYDEATRANLKLIGQRVIEEMDTSKMPDVYSVFSELFKNNEYSLQNYFSEDQWGHILNALNGFSTMYHYQEYSKQEFSKPIDEYAQEFLKTIVQVSKDYCMPLGINLMLIKIAHEKFFGIDTYQQEEIPTYHAQTMMKTLAALFQGDSSTTAELVHPLAAKFRFKPRNWQSLLGLRDNESGSFSRADITSVLAMPGRMLSPKLPMSYFEVIRMLLPTLGMHDVEVERYVNGYRSVLEHKNYINDKEPEYAAACEQLIQARDAITALRQNIYNLVLELVTSDPDKRMDVFTIRNGISDDQQPLVKYMREIGISTEQVDSWQYVHFTKTWLNAIHHNGDRDIPFDSKLFYLNTGKVHAYDSSPPEEILLEQFLNDKFFNLLDRMYTDESTDQNIKGLYLQLKTLREQHAQAIREVHYAQAIVEKILVKKDTDLTFQIHIGTAFIKSLYQMVEKELNFELSDAIKFDRDLQGFILFAICTIREISPVKVLTTFDNADSIKSPIIDAVYDEQKVLAALKGFIREAQGYGLLGKDYKEQFLRFATLLLSAEGTPISMHISDLDDDTEVEWTKIVAKYFKQFSGFPEIGYNDGKNASEGYKEPALGESNQATSATPRQSEQSPSIGMYAAMHKSSVDLERREKDATTVDRYAANNDVAAQ